MAITRATGQLMEQAKTVQAQTVYVGRDGVVTWRFRALLTDLQQQRRTGRRGVQEGRGVEPRSHRRSVGRGCHRVGARQERQRDGTGQPAG